MEKMHQKKKRENFMPEGKRKKNRQEKHYTPFPFLRFLSETTIIIIIIIIVIRLK